MVDELISKIRTIKFGNDSIVGTEIFNALPNMSYDDMERVAHAVASIYPTNLDIAEDPSRSHTPQALLIRNLFGVLKNGTLLDQSNPDRVDHLKQNYERTTEWDLSFEFAQLLKHAFHNIDNTYGILILAEMLGHRYGDLAIIGQDVEKNIALMKENYVESYNAARRINCKKQYFTPWYWGACYFSKLGRGLDAISWHTQFYVEAEDNMKGRPSYKDKLRRSLNLLKPYMSEDEFKGLVRKWSKSKNDFMKKIFKEYL